MIEIYTDGGYSIPKNKGAWAFALSKKEYQSESVQDSTSNRMELTAIIEAIKYTKDKYPKRNIKIYSDSKYCVNGFTYWMYGWEKNNWLRINGEPLLNIDLWKQLYSLRQNVTLTWVKGHSGDNMNTFVDKLCSVRY